MNFTELANEAKNSFNHYVENKSAYSASPTPENEQSMDRELTMLLRQLLGLAKELGAQTESGVERERLQQFAGELARIFKWGE